MKKLTSGILAVATSLSLALGAVQPASAAPVEPGMSVEELTTFATTQSPEIQAAISELLKLATGQALPYAESSSEAADEYAPAKRGDSQERKELVPPAVFGCGVGDLLLTTGKPSVIPGPNYGLGPVLGKQSVTNPYVPHGHARYQLFVVNEKLAPQYKGTDVKVAWLNLRTFKGGVDEMNDSFLGAKIHSITAGTVKTGRGPVIAAFAGKVAYSGGETCTVMPVISTVTVE